MTLGSKLQLLRWDLKLSQRQLARLLQVSINTISRWENDRFVPSLKYAALIQIIAKSKGIELDISFFEA